MRSLFIFPERMQIPRFRTSSPCFRRTNDKKETVQDSLFFMSGRQIDFFLESVPVLSEKPVVCFHILELPPCLRYDGRGIQIVEKRALHREEKRAVGGDHELTAEEAGEFQNQLRLLTERLTLLERARSSLLDTCGELRSAMGVSPADREAVLSETVGSTIASLNRYAASCGDELKRCAESVKQSLKEDN